MVFVERTVLSTDAGGCRVDHDIAFGDEFVDRSSEVDAGGGELVSTVVVGSVDGISRFSCADGDVVRTAFRDATDLHIGLCTDRIGDAFTDGSVSVDSDPYHTSYSPPPTPITVSQIIYRC